MTPSLEPQFFYLEFLCLPYSTWFLSLFFFLLCCYFLNFVFLQKSPAFPLPVHVVITSFPILPDKMISGEIGKDETKFHH